MVQFVPSNDPWASVGQSLGAGLGSGYTNRVDELAIRNAIEKLGPNPNPRQLLDTLVGTRTYSPESKQQALSNYLGVEQFQELQRHSKAQEEASLAKQSAELAKQEQERSRAKQITQQLELPEEQKEALSETLSAGAAEDLLKKQISGEKQSPFEKKVQEHNAQEYIKLTEEIPRLESTEGDIQRARELSKELSFLSPVTGRLGLSGKASELEAISLPMIESIVKIFNPTGAIGQQKLKLIADKYVIKAGDLPWQRTAKLDALDRFNKQALHRARDRLEILQKYNGNPPPEVLKEFDKESETVADAMLDYSLQEEVKLPSNIPPASSFSGKTITSPEGQKYRSDGNKWVKI